MYLSGFPVRKLQALAIVLRERYRLTQVYFVERKGQRAHHLCGDGAAGFDRAGHLELGNGLAVYWHGRLSNRQRAEMKNCIADELDMNQ